MASILHDMKKSKFETYKKYVLQKYTMSPEQKIRIAVVQRNKVIGGHDWYKRSEGETYYAAHGKTERKVLVGPLFTDESCFSINEKYIIWQCIKKGETEIKHELFDDKDTFDRYRKEYEAWRFLQDESLDLQQQLGEDFVVEEKWESLSPIEIVNISKIDLDESKEMIEIPKALGIYKSYSLTQDEKSIHPLPELLISFQKKKLYKLPHKKLNIRQEYVYMKNVGCTDISFQDVSLLEIITPQVKHLYPIDIAIELLDFQLLFNLLRSGASRSDLIKPKYILQGLINQLHETTPSETNASAIDYLKSLSIQNCGFRDMESLYMLADDPPYDLESVFINVVKRNCKTKWEPIINGEFRQKDYSILT